MGEYTKQLEKRVKTRGPKIGFCSICRVKTELTRDHVPPQGCGNVSDMILRTFSVQNESNGPKSHSQGGSHFKTICSICNNTFLGIEYDPELVSLYNEVVNLAKSAYSKRVLIPAQSNHIVKPQKIARAVVGHLLAANAMKFVTDNSISYPFYDSLREYFLNPELALPEKLEIFYWLYPHNDIRVIRALSKTQFGSKKYIFGDIIKFPPFGFWLVWDMPKSVNIPLNKLVLRKDMPLNESSILSFNYRSIPDQNFPEAPSGNEIAAFNDGFSSVATEKV